MVAYAYGAGGDYNKYKGVALVVMATNIKDMDLVVITKIRRIPDIPGVQLYTFQVFVVL